MFLNRTDAATRLAEALAHHSREPVSVWAVAGSGVLTGTVVATALNARLQTVDTSGCGYMEGDAAAHLPVKRTVPAEIAIVVDEGMVSGETMLRAIGQVRRTHPVRIIAAVPAATSHAVRRVRGTADEVLVLLEMADGLEDLASCYREFEPISGGVNGIRTSEPAKQ